MTTGRLLSPDEVAQILGVSTTTLAKWRQVGDPDLPYIRLAGRIRYRPADVEALLEDDDDDEDEDDVEAEEDGDEGDDGNGDEE